MDKEKINDLKEVSKGHLLETILTVGSDTTAEVIKASTTSFFEDLLIDTASSLIPGISGAVQGYKRARFEKNITAFARELSLKIEEFRKNWESKNEV